MGRASGGAARHPPHRRQGGCEPRRSADDRPGELRRPRRLARRAPQHPPPRRQGARGRHPDHRRHGTVRPGAPRPARTPRGRRHRHEREVDRDRADPPSVRHRRCAFAGAGQHRRTDPRCRAAAGWRRLCGGAVVLSDRPHPLARLRRGGAAERHARSPRPLRRLRRLRRVQGAAVRHAVGRPGRRDRAERRHVRRHRRPRVRDRAAAWHRACAWTRAAGRPCRGRTTR